MHSLHIDTSPAWQGGQRQVFDLVVGLRERGDRATLVAHPGGPLFRRMTEGMDVVGLAPKGDVDIAAAWRLSRVLKASRPDVVHAHDSHAVAMAATAIAIISGPTHLPLVVTRRSEFRPERTTFSKWKYSQVDAFVATNGSVRQRLLAEGVPSSRVALIPPGVDVDRIERVEPANLHAELFLPTNAPIVGNVGILDQQKGHNHLIAAAGLVLHDVPDARFIIMGEGPQRAALTRDVHARHLDRHVFLPGFHADSARHLKGFDVYASAALHVTGSLALIEAMAASRPIVATAVGHVPDLIEDGVTGLLVPPKDERALASAIALLLKDEDLRQALGDSARARARSEFSLDRMVETTAALYEQVRGRPVRSAAATSGQTTGDRAGTDP